MARCKKNLLSIEDETTGFKISIANFYADTKYVYELIERMMDEIKAKEKDERKSRIKPKFDRF